jgi:hypothetical protein
MRCDGDGGGVSVSGGSAREPYEAFEGRWIWWTMRRRSCGVMDRLLCKKLLACVNDGKIKRDSPRMVDDADGGHVSRASKAVGRREKMN